MLNNHPRITCFHGGRSLPGGDTPLSPEQYASELTRFETLNSGQVYGGCHGFHGLSIKEAVEERGGKFFGIVRHPVMRIDSIFQAFAGVFLSYGVLKTDAPVDLEKLLSDLQPVALSRDHCS